MTKSGSRTPAENEDEAAAGGEAAREHAARRGGGTLPAPRPERRQDLEAGGLHPAEMVGAAKDRVVDLRHAMTDELRAHPLRTLCIAGGMGFVLGRWMMR
jgi:hypothetical protein